MLRANILRTAFNVTKATCRAEAVDCIQMRSASTIAAASTSSPPPSFPIDSSYKNWDISRNMLGALGSKIDTSSLFEYRTWRDEDVNDVVDFIVKNFIRREVLMRAHSATDANARKYIEYCIEEAHHQGASFLARDMRNNEIKGVRVNGIGPRNGLELLQDFGPEMNSVARLMHTAELTLQSMAGYQDFMRHVIICVSPEVIKSGVATRMNQLCWQFATDNNLSHLTATCTSGIPEQLAKKCGFKLHAKLSYDKYARQHKHLMDSKTFQIYQKLAAVHGHARIMTKQV